MDGDNGSGTPSEVEVSVDGVTFSMRVSDDPSGLRGQVFHGHEKIAGVQIYHQKSVDKLIAMAERDRAVLRAAERLKGGSERA